MTRMRGFEDYAEQQGRGGVLHLDGPSRFHAWKTGRNGKTIENDSTRAPPHAKPAPIWPSSGA